MTQTTQNFVFANSIIKDQNGNQLGIGNYKAIQLDSPSPGVKNIHVTSSLGSFTTSYENPKFQIVFPNQGSTIIWGSPHGIQTNWKELTKVDGNSITLTVNDATGSNSIQTISVQNGTTWTSLILENNPSKVTISLNFTPKSEVSSLLEGEPLWTSEKWNNNNSRTLTGHGEKDPDDSKLQVRAGNDNKRKFEIDGKGTAFLSGNQSRVYINAHNYNVAMQLTYTHKKSLINLSLRMRSLRNEFEEDEDNSKRFGGYGLIIHRDNFKAEYQPSKDEGKEDLSSKELPKKLPEDSPVTVRWWVRDRGEKIEVKAWIKYDENGEFEEVIDVSSEKYEKIARDKDEFREHGVAWIRANGIDNKVSPTDIPFKDVHIIELKE
jgi:hypothetical protein